MIKTLLWISVFLLSSFGFWDCFRRKSTVSVYFIPVLTVAGQFCVLLTAGFLNILTEAVLAMYIGGIFLLGRSLRRDFSGTVRPYLNWGYLFFFCFLAAFALSLRGNLLVVEDDLAHWGLAVKKILETGRLPNFTDTVIGFQKYPLGSSLWICFFCFFAGPQEDLMALAQCYMLLCCLLPMWHMVWGNKLLCTGFLILAANLVLIYNIPTYSLMVDTLLPLAGMTAIFFILCHREKGRDCLFGAVLLLIWTAQIKNSGLLFAAAGAALLLIPGTQGHRELPVRLACAASPVIGFLLWSRHCDLVFSDSAFSKHAVSVEGYSAIFGLKTSQQIRQILVNITRYVLEREGLILVLIWIAVLVVITLTLLRRFRKDLFLLCICCGVLMLLYYAGICGMYLFSMPTEEAMRLAAIERYMKTLDIALFYLLTIFSLQLLSAGKTVTVTALCSIALVCLSLWQYQFLYKAFPVCFTKGRGEEREMFNAVLEEYGVQPGSSYMICKEGYLDYHFFLCRYYLDSTPLCIQVEEPAQLEAAEDYDVLINFDTENPIIAQWIEENYPQFQGEQVVYMYN